jgi:hypothetical protein
MTLRPKQTPAEGKFVINLCSVDTPITIPQPQSPQLTRFKFFLSHHLEGGRKRYTLHMGYFATTADAQKWLTILGAVYPNAFVSDSGAVTEDTFSDTQVMSILEQRGAERATAGSAENAASRNIPMLRPDDTGTRRALKDAVATDAAVSFVVQLQCSSRPIALAQIRSHDIFDSYKLYETQARLEGRDLFCLRLGFFSDAGSARQVAQYLLSDFPSAAVIPVSPQEQTLALQSGGRSLAPAAPPAHSATRRRAAT